MFLNVVFLQVLWCGAILGAANEMMMPALAWFVMFFCWHAWFNGHARQDLAIVLLATPVGFVLDSLWVQLGLLKFSYAIPHPGFAPYWIAMLWAGLALTVNHSLRWLQSRPLAAAVLCMISAPLSYFAASRLGAAEIIEPLRLYVLLGLSWAVFIPLLLLFARSLDKPEMVGRCL
jgi:hypothetical protein